MRQLLFNGKIFVEKGRFCEAVYIEGERVKDVGSDDQLRQKYENQTEKVVDLQGATVIPGFNDSHLHLSYVGEGMAICNLIGTDSIDDLIQRGRSYHKDRGQLPFILGRGWNQDFFLKGENRLPHRKDLDRISLDTPIVFDRVCGHVAVGNTKALEMAGISVMTGIPGGTIGKDSRGQLNGIVTENAVTFLKRIIPRWKKEERKEHLRLGAEYALSKGITSVQSADVSGPLFKEGFQWIHEAFQEKMIPLRYRHQFNFQDPEGFREYLKWEDQSAYREDYYERGSLKIFKDGSLGGRTAFMKKPYRDDPGNYGVEAIEDEVLYSLVKMADHAGIAAVVHGIGDGAVESILKIIETVDGGRGNPLRHGIVHNQITDEVQLKRIIQGKIAVLAQPVFIDYDWKIVEDRVGEDLAKTSYAFGTLYRNHALISFGTDAPVEDLDPFGNLYAAVTRKDKEGNPEEGYNSEEGLTVEEAVDAYTYGSAVNEHKERVKGRLLPGYYADFTVLDRDIFRVDAKEILETKVLNTVVGGKRVYGN